MKVLTDKVETGTWYRKTLDNGVSSTGGSYHIMFKKGTVNKLLVFFVGGGVSWNAETTSKPLTIGAMLRKKDAFYVNSVSPLQLKFMHVGILNTNDKRNPFSDWHILTIPYSTADFHLGNNKYPYKDIKGDDKVMHHHGASNVREALEVLKEFVPETPDTLMIAGVSAGGFGCVAHSPQIKNLYPACENIIVYSEGAYFHFPLLPSVAKDVWKVNHDLEQYIKSSDLITDLFHYAQNNMPSHTIFLHSNSVWDKDLVKFMNKMNHDNFSINSQALKEFYDNLTSSVKQLKNEIPTYYYYLTDYGKNQKNGTTPHIFSATPKLFYSEMQDNLSIANWLTQAFENNPLDVGVKFTESND